MRRQLWLSLIVAGTWIIIQPGSSALAQAPGGHVSMGGQTPSNFPGDNPTARPGAMPDNTPAQTEVDDKRFVKDAAMAALTEAEVGKLAAQKASSDFIKQFGQSTVDDQTKLETELKQVASNAKVDVPNSVDSKHQSRIDKLSKLSGPEFDRAFLKDLKKDHAQDVREFQQEAQNGSDPGVKEFASKNLPTLQQHLETAKSLSNEEKNHQK
jgi:putative membrane protein